ncbi:ASCH domain-containing protein [Sporomusa sphaeroides DSM 2875]|uniref:ASCH domain-containing protein n=1 Tax=Sporomusa sphaeroides TaxID=47679 RepID=UPI0020301A3B|nr:ASCH domain-containing protein [Sporomusa sphaeroides]MCM0760681.1 ASCH domain-containing protein [Sporomusa sphaeroides DSM 2875]
MKAITILQPWASLIACGAKQIETRSWATKYRGPIAIHAGAKPFDTRTYFDRELYRFADALGQPDIYGFDQLPFGAVIAIAELVDCRPTESFVFSGTLRDISENEIAFGDYTPGRYAWILANVRPIKPVPAKGMQRFWEWGGGTGSETV